MPVLRVKDQAGAWVPATAVGPTGPVGATGITGPTGPQGPIDIRLEEIVAGPTQPDLAAQPLAEIWYDSATPLPTKPGIPPGGTTDQSLTVTDSTGIADWRGPNLKLSGGTLTGGLAVQGDVVVGTLASYDVRKYVWFDNNIDAADVDDRTAFEWEEWDAKANLVGGWESDGTRGPCKVWRNRYNVLVNMDLQRSGDRPFHTWMSVLSSPIPDRFCPAIMLWDTFTGVEITWQGPTFAIKIQPDGHIWLWATGEWKWQTNTRIPVYFCFPAKSI